MSKSLVRVVGAILLIAAGIALLLQNIGFLGAGLDLLWALLLGAGGVVLLTVFLTEPANWWAIIPGLLLLSLAAVVALSQLAPRIGETVSGPLVLISLGLAFWVIYLSNRENWWALIPGGVLTTVAVVAALGSIIEGVDSGGVFMLGLGLTFGLLSLVRTPEGQMKWALIPAAVFLVIGLFISAASASLLQYLGPAALIAAGLYGILRGLGRRREQGEEARDA